MVKKIIGLLGVAASCVADYKTDKIFIASIPKCGTHLIGRGLQLMTERPLGNLSFMKSGPEAVALDQIPAAPNHEILLDHVPYSKDAENVLKKHGFKGFFIYRDPRDQLVSMAFWVLAHPDFYKEFGELARSPKNFPKILSKLIEGIDGYYRKYIGWMQAKNFLALKFEDLIGVQGGGSASVQYTTLNAIAKHIGMPIDKKKLEYVVHNIYGNTGTFREGKTRGWKTHFKTWHCKLMKKKAGQLLIDLGYETDLNW